MVTYDCIGSEPPYLYSVGRTSRGQDTGEQLIPVFAAQINAHAVPWMYRTSELCRLGGILMVTEPSLRTAKKPGQLYED